MRFSVVTSHLHQLKNKKIKNKCYQDNLLPKVRYNGLANINVKLMRVITFAFCDNIHNYGMISNNNNNKKKPYLYITAEWETKDIAAFEDAWWQGVSGELLSLLWDEERSWEVYDI